MDVAFIGVAAISFCLPGFWLCLGALCTALAHLHFVHLHSLWVVEVAFVTGLILCFSGILGAFGATRRCLWPISVFVGTAFAVISLEAATGVVFLCQWNLVEETAKEHDQTGALLLVLRCIEAHPIIFSWLVGSFFILQVATLFLAAHHAFNIAMDTEEPEEESGLEEGDRCGDKAPLLLAYEQAYLPKPSKPSSQNPEGEQHFVFPPACHKQEPSKARYRVPEWRDVLLTAALLWLAATGLVLIIAMVKVDMYQDPGLGHHASSAEDGPKHAVQQIDPTALPAAHAAPSGVKSLVLSALDSLGLHSGSKDHAHDHLPGKHVMAASSADDDDDDDENDSNDDSDDKEDSDHHNSKAAGKHSEKVEKRPKHRKEGKEEDSKAQDHDHDDSEDDSEGDESEEEEERNEKGSRGKEDAKEDDDEEEGEEDRADIAGELGKKPWKKHHHHKKHRKHRKHCTEEDQPSCQDGAPRWFAGVLGVVGVPMLVLSSVAGAGVWCGFAAVLHMFAGASAVFLAAEALLVHMCFAHGPILVTAAEFDNSNGLQRTLDFASEHSFATPLLVIALLACQAGAMVAAANFGTPIPVKTRVITASTQLRQKVEEMQLPQRSAILYRHARTKSAVAAESLRGAAGRAAERAAGAVERAGFPAAAARIAGSFPAASSQPGSAETVHPYSLVASAAEEAAASDGEASVKDDASTGSDSKDPWATLRRALVPEGSAGSQRPVRWSEKD